MKKLNDQNTEIVKKIIATFAEVDVNEITDTDSLKNDFDFDSIDFIEVIMEIEKEFNIMIPDHELEEPKTVDDLCHIVALYL